MGERIIVTGRVLDSRRPAGARHADRDLAGERGRALPARGATTTRRRSTRTSPASGRCLTDAERPVPVRHHQARRLPVGEPPQRLARPRTSTSRCSAGRSPSGWSPRCTSPATRCSPLDPIFNSVPDEKARQRLIAGFDLELTQPEWALGYEWDIVLRGRDATVFEYGAERTVPPLTPSQTVGPYFCHAAALARRPVRGARGHPGRDHDHRRGSTTAPGTSSRTG